MQTRRRFYILYQIRFFFANSEFFNDIDRNSNIQRFNVHFQKKEMKLRNYKILLNFLFDSTISKIDKARIELFKCKKTIFFSLSIQNFLSLSIITTF